MKRKGGWVSGCPWLEYDPEKEPDEPDKYLEGEQHHPQYELDRQSYSEEY
jgi:hypothetical protein